MKRPAVFLDRDGTINVEKEYLYRPEDLELIPGAAEGISRLSRAGYLIVVVSNQSGVGRGYYSEDDVRRLHGSLDRELAGYGAAVDAYYYCPHHPEHGIGDYRLDCTCRKPLPGMILRAAGELEIDLAGSYMIGDKQVDMEAARAAGCTPILVRTGYGAEEELRGSGDLPVFDDLRAAAEEIVRRASSPHH